MAKTKKRKVAALATGFLRELYYGDLCGKLDKWYFEQEQFEARKDILPFVTGLRFSALLIYTIRKALSNTSLTASWGAILDEDSTCSPECDIIVHDDKWIHAWNGGDGADSPVMDFRFVSKEDAKLVISCKSALYTGIDDKIKDDHLRVGDYVDRIWLFTQRCEKGRVERYRKEAADAGYHAFFYLYTFDKKHAGQEYNEPGWIQFVQELRLLANT